MTETYNIALYLRVSDEDEQKEAGESNSIIGQRMLLEYYIETRPEFSNAEILTFSDDGYSGTDFNRPGIKALLELVKEKAIDCIIVKDLSRLGRNYIEVGSYIEEIFPFMGIRFISVNDNFDSKNAAPGLDTAFKNLIHQIYSKDLSKKIKSIRQFKASNGKFITAFAPYGYKKSTVHKNKLEPDEETQVIVTRIFQMAAENIPKTQIARILNQESVPSPQSLNTQRKSGLKNHKSRADAFWTASTVVRILSDQRYTGTAVYGKTQPKNVGSRKAVIVPEAQQYIVPNSHPALISPEIFRTVNSTIKHHSYKRYPQRLLSGKLYCQECNRAPVRRRCSEEENAYYICRTRRFTSQYKCYNEKIKEKQILTAVQIFLKILIDLTESDFSKSNLINDIKSHNAYDKEISILMRKLDKLNINLLNSYEKYKKGLISPNKYSEIRTLSEKSLENTKKELSQLKNLSLSSQRSDDSGNSDNLSLTKEIIEVLIESVYVNSVGNINIKWTFKSPFTV